MRRVFVDRHSVFLARNIILPLDARVLVHGWYGSCGTRWFCRRGRTLGVPVQGRFCGL